MQMEQAIKNYEMFQKCDPFMNTTPVLVIKYQRKQLKVDYGYEQSPSEFQWCLELFGG